MKKIFNCWLWFCDDMVTSFLIAWLCWRYMAVLTWHGCADVAWVCHKFMTIILTIAIRSQCFEFVGNTPEHTAFSYLSRVCFKCKIFRVCQLLWSFKRASWNKFVAAPPANAKVPIPCYEHAVNRNRSISDPHLLLY